MSDQELRRSITLLCDDANRVHRVLHNPAGLPVSQGSALVALFDPGSRHKALRLVEAIRDRQAAFGWELHVRGYEEAAPMSFVGAGVPDGVLIAGAEDSAYANALLIRTLQEMDLTPPPRAETSPAQEGVGLYEQIAGLNNQLVTMQRELEKKNAEMSRLLEDRAAIAAMAAHDLRSPLQVILSSVQVLALIHETRAGAQTEPLLGMIRRNADTMLALVNDILFAYSADIGKLELSMQPLELEALVRSNAENNRALAQQKQIMVTFSASGPVPPVLGDAARLDQLLNNLVHNAIKFSPPGSTIRVDLSGGRDDALLEIADQGIGIEPEQLAALLRGAPIRSQAGTGSEPGFGLGFAIVRTVVEKHHGSLDGESAPGKGTKFSIRLPAYRQHSGDK